MAPELALDFDAQHVGSGEAVLSWLGAIGALTALYQGVKYSDPSSKNPAVNRTMNMVKDAPKIGP